jgi:hypothetical protein
MTERPGNRSPGAWRSPGSWALKRAIANQIPRRCGSFYWRQAHNALGAGATMIYNAMFDEVDEGTAMFKLAPTTDTVLMLPHVVTQDADGCRLPND